MQKRTKSILSELNRILPPENKHAVMENRGSHIIESCINFIDHIHSNFDAETAMELEKRLYSSIKNRDPKRFERGVRKVREEKK